MDWSEKNSCIKCDKGGNLLACSENDCPLAIHEGCLGRPAEFDDSGCFYCPYCSYKQSVAELRRAREYSLERKKAFSVFMNGKAKAPVKRIGEKKTCEDNGHDQSKSVDSNIDATSSADDKSKLNTDDIIDQIYEEEKTNNAVEDSGDSAGSKRQNTSLRIHGRKINTTEEEKKLEEEDHETAAEEDKIEEEGYETSSAHADTDSVTVLERAKRGSKRSEPVDKDSDADRVQSKLLKQQHGNEKQKSPTVTPMKRSGKAMRTGNAVAEEVMSPGRSRKAEEPSFRLETPGGAKRKMPLWTEEEEEALRAAVETHSNEPKLPWTKILEMGVASHQFHRSRTPSDLKNKWRKMAAK